MGFFPSVSHANMARLRAPAKPVFPKPDRNAVNLAYGSSSIGSTKNNDLDNLRTGNGSNIVNATFLNVKWDDRVKANLPSSTNKAFTIASIPVLVYNNNACNYEIYKKMEADAGLFNSGTIVWFGGVNAWTMTTSNPVQPLHVTPERGRTDSSFDSVDYGRMGLEIAEAAGAKTMFIHTFPLFGPNDQFKWGQWIRIQKYRRANRHMWRGYANFHEASLRTTYQCDQLDDVNARKAQFRPIGGAADDTAHSTPEAGYWAGEYFTLAEAALLGGVPFIPTGDYHWYTAADVVVIDVYGDISDATFTCDDPNFTLTRVATPGNANYPYELRMTLTGSPPAEAPHNVNITVTKVPYGAATYRIVTAVQRRAPTDFMPQPVIVLQGALWWKGFWDNFANTAFPASRKFAFCFIQRLLPHDGRDNKFVENGTGTNTASLAAGTRNGTSLPFLRIDWDGNLSALEVRRNGANGVSWTAIANSTGTPNVINTSVANGAVTEQQGVFALFGCYDADDPSKCMIYRSAGPNNLAINGSGYANYTASNTPITPANGGTIGFERTDGVDATGAQIRLWQDFEYQPANNISMVHYRTMFTNDWIDFTTSAAGIANRNKYFNEATQLPRALTDTGDGTTVTWTDAGSVFHSVTPVFDIFGDAAELYSGCNKYAWDHIAKGGKMAENMGSGEGLMSTPFRPFLHG